MAIDDSMAQLAKEFDETAVFRLYSWLTPTLSIGYHQNPETRIDFESCKQSGVSLTRRPTGGRELLHDGDLSFSIVARNQFEKSEAMGRSREFFFKVGQVIASGLDAMGIKTSIESGTLKTKVVGGSPCLLATSRYEIKAGGKKLIPVAQRLYPGSFLVHGSIPLSKSRISTASLLKIDNRDSLQRKIDESSTNLFQLSNKEVDIVEFKRELRLRFEEVFEGRIEYRSIPETVLTEALASKFKWEINKQQQ